MGDTALMIHIQSLIDDAKCFETVHTCSSLINSWLVLDYITSFDLDYLIIEPLSC